MPLEINSNQKTYMRIFLRYWTALTRCNFDVKR